MYTNIPTYNAHPPSSFDVKILVEKVRIVRGYLRVSAFIFQGLHDQDKVRE